MELTLTSSPLAFLRNEAVKYRSRIGGALARYTLAWRYARDRLTVEDGYRLLYDAEHAAGCFGLETLTESAVMEQACEMYGDVPGMAQWVRDAAASVSSDWTSDGHLSSAAVSWALDKVAEFAADDGVELVANDEADEAD